MEMFSKITADPKIAIGVEEVVYDARLFREYVLKAEYLEDYEELFPPPSDGNESDDDEEDGDTDPAVQSEKRYGQLYQDQTKILEEGRDFQALSNGLRRLPYLRSITVLDDFGHEIDTKSFEWYHSLVERLWKDIVPPIPMIEAERLWAADGPWAHPGIQHLLRAISINNLPIEALHCGWPSSGLHLEPFVTRVYPENEYEYDSGTCAISAHLETIVRNLTCMTLSSEYGELEFAGEYPSAEDAVVMGIVEHAKNLRSLSISLKRSSGVWNGIMPKASWPHLTALELGHWSLESDDLRRICCEHKNTLRELKLLNIKLDESGKLALWEDVGKEIGEFLRLDCLWLSHLGYSVPTSSRFAAELLSDVGMFGVGLSLLVRVPMAKLVVCSKEGVTFGCNGQRMTYPTSQLRQLLGAGSAHEHAIVTEYRPPAH